MYEVTGKFAAITNRQIRYSTYEYPEQGACKQTLKSYMLYKTPFTELFHIPDPK